jgi:hypothetical protein
VSAADSLILADVVELLGGGVISQHPLCPGAQITLVGFDFGAPQPQTEIVASLLRDGSIPVGRRADNRTISLPIQIRGPSRPIMDGARELLQQLVDADTWRLTWTPDPGTGTALPMIFDCFRATAVVNRDLVLEDSLVSQLTITFPALPFGRSDTQTTLVFPTPSSFPTPANPVRIDDYSTVSTTTQTTAGWWTQSSQHVADSFSAFWNQPVTDRDSGPFYTHTLAAPLDITGLPNLTFQFGLGTSNYKSWHAGNVTFAVTLTDNAAHTLSTGGVAYCVASNNTLSPTWTQVTFPIPTSATFDYTHLNSYSIHAWRFVDRDGALELDSAAYLNGLTAIASAQNPIAAIRGTLYQIPPRGTARAPMSTQFQSPPITTPATVTFSTAGPFTWPVPAGVTVGAVSVKGATGKGGDRTTAGAGGGAGGGAGATHATYPLVPGTVLSGYIGAAGGSGGFPTLVASYFDHEDAWNYNTLVTPSFTPTAGELIVVKALNSERSQTFGTPTGGGLTFTNRVDQNVTSHCRADIWTATVGGSPTAMTISLTVAASQQNHAFVVERWSGAKLAGSPAVINATGSGAPSAVETTIANNSVISWVNGDFDQGTGARTYRGTPTEEQYWTAGDCTGYFAWQTQATAGAVTVGLTAPSQTWTMAAIEIQAFNTGALTDGGASTFDGTAFIADGGKSVPVNTATGASGGLASASVVPAGGTTFNGGNGFTASTTGGGAGSSAGDALAGVNAAGQAGATAPSGGISGGAGGAAGGNNAGVVPGGGSFSIGGSVSGAAGAAGKVTITYTPPLAAFKTLLAHSPSYLAPPTLNPLIPAGSGLDPPDGREYTIASPVPGLPARYYGTYTIIVFFSTINTPSASRVVTVTFRQYDYVGGPSTSRSVARTLTPSTESPPIANGFVVIGELTLPCRDHAQDNTAAFYTAAVNSTNASDRALDIVAIDVRGQTAAINISGTGHVNYYLDEPSTDRDWGRVLASDYDRAQATSVLDANDMILTGGPLVIDPAGAGWLLAYSPDAGAPGLTATFYPRWRDSRLS